jgi:hypothetical protein
MSQPEKRVYCGPLARGKGAEEEPMEEAAIIREAVVEAWEAIEQALLQLEHLSREEAWQVLLAPFGLRVLHRAHAPEVPGPAAPHP